MAKVSLKKKVPAVKKRVAKHAQLEAKIGLMISNGEDYRDESLEEMIDKFREFCRTTWTGHHNLTVVGSYYIIDGKVCRPEDFDRETMDRKPGTFPPSWSLSGEEKKDADKAEKEKEQAIRQAAKNAEQKLVPSKPVRVALKRNPVPTGSKVPQKEIFVKKKALKLKVAK